MAQPARKHDPYNQPGNQESDPRSSLKALKGGNETSEPKRGHLKSADQPNDEQPKEDDSSSKLKALEGGGEKSEPKKGHLSAVDDAEASLYKSGDSKQAKKGGLSLFGIGITKRRAIFGGGGITGGAIALLIFTIISGPGQFLQLSHVLQRNFEGNDKTTHLRLSRMMRYGKEGAIGETRVTSTGSRIFGRYNAKLADAGVEFTRSAGGRVNGVTFDVDKLQEKFPEMKDMTAAEQHAFIAEKAGMPYDQLRPDGARSFRAGNDFTDLKMTRSFIKGNLAFLDSGKIVNGIVMRQFAKFFDVANLFHPIEKARRQVGANRDARATKAAEDRAYAEEEAEKAQKPTQTPEAVAARESVRDKLAARSGIINSFLIAQAGLCLIRSMADDAVTVNRAAIVLPPVINAADKVAVGEQIESNKDFDGSQLGPIARSFVDTNGQTIWAAAALQATAGKASPGGPDLPTEFEQAFSGKTTAQGIRDSLEVNILGFDLTDAACSTAGQIVGAVAGIVLLVAGAPTDGATWAAYAGYAAGQAAQLAAMGGIVYMLQHELQPILEDQAVVPAVLRGPLGGNLLAYGARELGNMNSRSMGGIPMVGTTTSVVSAAQEQEDAQQFKQQSIAKKLFDTGDYRSVAGRLAANTSPNVMNNVSSVGSIFLHPGNIFSSFANLFSAHSFAATPLYNWGSDRVGVPDYVATSPSYEDPYANAEVVAQMLDNDPLNAIHDRIKSCFGVDVNKDPQGLWQVVPSGDVNPGSRDFTDANCTDQSDAWHRIMLFVDDSRIMDAVNCYSGDEADPDTIQSCNNAQGTPPEAATPTTPTTPTAGGACTVNAPVHGSVNGSGSEYTTTELAAIYGDPGTAASHAAMSANLVSVDFLGHSVQINKVAAPCLTAVAQEIQASGSTYQINDMGCYRFDSDNGSSNIGLRSYHTYGAACDINPSTNPYVGNGAPTAHDMPQEYIDAFNHHGFTWGGNWHSVKDYMHFEFNGVTP